MDINTSFDEYLESKKIDTTVFQKVEPKLYTEWKNLFMAIHPDSFTAQKKFLLNKLRRKFILAEKVYK